MAMATTSRYAPTVAGASDSRTSGTTSGSSTTSGSQTSSGTTSSTGTSNTSNKTTNLDDKGLAALNQLIKQLQNGGTAEMQQQRAVRDGEIATVQGIRAGYSKEDAFNDAQGLMALQMRRTMEQLIPSIGRAAESAGSSGGALRALLLQDAAQRAAESSSAAGLNTAVQYGGIQGNLSGVLEGLTRSDPAATQALIQALGVAKGAVVTSNGSQSSSSNSVTTGQQQNTGSTSTQTNSNSSVDYAPYAVPRNTSPIYYGPLEGDPTGIAVGSTLHTLTELAKDNSWSDYTF